MASTKKENVRESLRKQSILTVCSLVVVDTLRLDRKKYCKLFSARCSSIYTMS